MKKGFTLIELLIVILIIAILVAILLPVLAKVQENAKQIKCKANLDQMGKSFQLYRNDLGKGVNFPDADGAGFVVRLYRTGILGDAPVYLCPSTPDDNGEGRELETIIGEEVNTNVVSYAGRKNKVQAVYPGIFRPNDDTSGTAICADDDDQPSGEVTNHPKLSNFLFLDGHSDHLRIEDAKFIDLRDPLTN